MFELYCKNLHDETVQKSIKNVKDKFKQYLIDNELFEELVKLEKILNN